MKYLVFIAAFLLFFISADSVVNANLASSSDSKCTIGEMEVLLTLPGRFQILKPKEDKLNGKFGGRRYVIKKYPGSKWTSTHEEFPQGTEGNPMRFIEIAGVRLASFFGFELLDANTLLVPDAVELNGAIEALNKVLIEMNQPPIPVRFQETDSPQLTPEVALEWYAKGIIPYAKLSSLTIHDISFHVPSLLLPAAYWLRAMEREGMILKFRDYFKERHGKVYEIPNVQMTFETIIRRAGNSFDIGSGNAMESWVFAGEDSADRKLMESLEILEHGDELAEFNGMAAQSVLPDLKKVEQASGIKGLVSDFMSIHPELAQKQPQLSIDPRVHPELYNQPWIRIGIENAKVWISHRISQIEIAANKALREGVGR